MATMYIPELDVEADYPDGMDEAQARAEIMRVAQENAAKLNDWQLGTSDLGISDDGIAKTDAAADKAGIGKKALSFAIDHFINRPMAAAAGAASMVPGSQALSAFAGHNIENAVRGLRGEKLEGLKGFVDRYRSQGAIQDQLQEKSPMMATAGKVAGAIATGGGIQGAVESKLAPLLAKIGFRGLSRPVSSTVGGAAGNVVVGQQDGYDESRMAGDALLGGGFGAGAEALSAGSKALSGPLKRFALNLMRGAVKQPRGEELDIAEAMLNRGMWGTKGGLEAKAAKGLSANEDILQRSLSAAGDAPIDRGVVSDELLDLTKYYLKNDMPEEALKVNSAMKEFWQGKRGAEAAKQMGLKPPARQMNAARANEMKRDIYSMREKAYRSNASVEPVKAEIDMAKARGLKEAIEQLVPTAKATNQELQFYGVLQDALEGMPSRFAGPSLKSLVGATGGGSVGGPAGALAGLLGIDVIGSTVGKSAGAVGIKKAIEALTKYSRGARLAAPAITGATSD